MPRESLLGTPLRRRIAAGAAVLGLATTGVVAANAAGFDFGTRRPVDSQGQRLPDTPQASDIEQNFQQFAAPRIASLLESLGQVQYLEDGFTRLPESGITIFTGRVGSAGEFQQLFINKDSVTGEGVDTETKGNTISIYYKFGTDKIESIELQTLYIHGIPPTMTSRGDFTEFLSENTRLSIENGVGNLSISEFNEPNSSSTSWQRFSTDPSSQEEKPLEQQEITAFNQTLEEIIDIINPRTPESADTVDNKMSEWQETLSQLTNNANRSVNIPDPSEVTNGMPQIEITAQADADTSYHISYTLEDGEIRGLVVIKNKKGTPFVEHEYQIYQAGNDSDWDLTYSYFENGTGARGMSQVSGSTDPSAAKNLTTTQFEAWSQDIDKILGEVSAIQ